MVRAICNKRPAKPATLQLPLVSSPDFEIRALHIVIRNTSLGDAKRLVDQARLARLNTLIVQLADYVDFGIAGWPVQKGAWSVDELQQFARYVRASGLEFIPEVKLLTHQEKFFAAAFPALMYNKVTYDPRNPEVYGHVFGYLDKLIAAVEPDIIHIGHDEAFGFSERTHKKWLAPGEKPLPADLFLADVLKLHGYLMDRNIMVWMWADMLISSDEPTLAGMFENELHGWGDYPSIRAKLPKSIVMVDWHYSEKQDCFPSLKLLQEAGYRTLGSTWDRESTTDRFSRYAAASGAPGMVQTLWNYVQRRRWAETDAMIAYAGAKYWDTGNTDPVAAECGLMAQ